jgi:parvulin-like peptidyl-prolyl isomerase
MLDTLRKSGASVFIYLIFGLLIVIFVINFAPNAGQGGGGCMGGGSTPITVNGEKSNLTAYKIAYSGNQYNGRQKVYLALELLIRKELLAQEAEKRGIRVTGDLVDEEIKKGSFFLGGNRIQAGYWLDDIDGQKFFNYGKLKGWVGNLNVSMGSYRDEQARSMQASMMADILRDSVTVSREEAKANYLFEHTTAAYDVVAFEPSAYRDAMRLTDADIARFLSTHEAEVKKKFADEERTYKATKPALKLRSIFIAAHKPEAAPATPDGAEKKPATPTIDEAKAKLETARTAIAGNKQKFADAAKQLASNEAAKANGGDLGWRSVENPQLGDKAVNEAVKALKPGEMTPVITTDSGAWLVIAEEKREGDLTFDQVKNEIAVELAKDVWSKEAAKRAALDALKTAGEGKSLEQLFPPSVEDQIKQQIPPEMFNKQGAIVPVVKDELAAWKADDTGSAAAEAGDKAPAAGSAAAPAAGSATATGSAAGAPEAAPPAPAAPSTEIVASNDVLPAFGEIKKPSVTSYGPVPRMKELPALGGDKDAINAVFDELSDGMIAKRVYEHNGTFLVLQLKAKAQPKVEEFDKVADQEINELRQLRGYFALESWLKDRCVTLAKDGKIKPMADLIRESDDAGKTLPVVYQPCMTFR